MVPFARHSLIELTGCDPALLKDAAALKPRLLAAVEQGGGSIVTDFFHNFSPYGVSGVVVIAESHVAIHTWPEHGFAAVDIFSCTAALDQERITELIRVAVSASGVNVRTIDRNGTPLTEAGARTFPAARQNSPDEALRSAV